MANNMGEATVDDVAQDIIADIKNGLKPTLDAIFTKVASHQNQTVRLQRLKYN